MSKDILVALIIGVTSMVGGLVIGAVTRKTIGSIVTQPEAYSKIRASYMLALVFIETVIIYALLIVILIIFVI